MLCGRSDGGTNSTVTSAGCWLGQPTWSKASYPTSECCLLCLLNGNPLPLLQKRLHQAIPARALAQGPAHRGCLSMRPWHSSTGAGALSQLPRCCFGWPVLPGDCRREGGGASPRAGKWASLCDLTMGRLDWARPNIPHAFHHPLAHNIWGLCALPTTWRDPSGSCSGSALLLRVARICSR